MKALPTIIIALATVLTAASEPDGFRYCPYNGHYYKFVHVPGGISWSEAKAAAEKAGGYLATITSVKETNFIGQFVKRKELWESTSPFDNFGPWIGGYQDKNGREPDGGWQWVTGEPFFYANWATMEPSGRWKGKDENRLHLYCKNSKQRRAYWNDALDSPKDITIRGYIIEKGAVDSAPQDAVITKAINEFHEFRSTAGKTCRGRVLGYNPNNDTVTIAKENKSSHKVGLSCFSEADRTYVREWHLVKEFCNPNRLKISAKQERVGREREIEFHDNQGNQRQLQVMVNMAYDITLDSHTGADLNNLTIDYCIYYQQERPSPHGPMANHGVKCGSLNIGTLAGRAKLQARTQSVIISKHEYYSEYRDTMELKGEIQGIWIRVYLPLANGKKAMREYAIPKALMKDRQWATSDVLIGQNKW